MVFCSDGTFEMTVRLDVQFRWINLIYLTLQSKQAK